MIKVIVDTEDELKIVRRILHGEACTHTPTCDLGNLGKPGIQACSDCTIRYCADNVKLYKKQTIEIPASLVV